MILKLKTIKAAEPVLNKILNAPMAAKLSYKLRKNVDIINKELQSIEVERQNLVRKYGEVKDNNITVSPDRTTDFIKEMTDLLEAEIDIPITPIPFECLDKIELSVIEMSVIDPFLENQ